MTIRNPLPSPQLTTPRAGGMEGAVPTQFEALVLGRATGQLPLGPRGGEAPSRPSQSSASAQSCDFTPVVPSTHEPQSKVYGVSVMPVSLIQHCARHAAGTQQTRAERAEL